MKKHEKLVREMQAIEQRIKQMLHEPDTYGKCSYCREGEMVITHKSLLWPEGVAYHLRCSHCGYEEVEPFD